MEKNELRIKQTLLVFSTIIQTAINPSFKVSGGGKTVRVVEEWLTAMDKKFGEISGDRIVDYCVCQGYYISQLKDDYTEVNWDITHSFSSSGRSFERYSNTKKQIKYYEDQWLLSNGMSRKQLSKNTTDTSKHPLSKYIYPLYEDRDKERLLSTDAGYFMCEKTSTLYTPFSPVCQKCTSQKLCIERTKLFYPELYRVRMEAWNQNN